LRANNRINSLGSREEFHVDANTRWSFALDYTFHPDTHAFFISGLKKLIPIIKYELNAAEEVTAISRIGDSGGANPPLFRTRRRSPSLLADRENHDFHPSYDNPFYRCRTRALYSRGANHGPNGRLSALYSDTQQQYLFIYCYRTSKASLRFAPLHPHQIIPSAWVLSISLPQLLYSPSLSSS